jgi:hypothetical protein
MKKRQLVEGVFMKYRATKLLTAIFVAFSFPIFDVSAACNAADAEKGEIKVEVNGVEIEPDELVYISAVPEMPIMKASLTGAISGNLQWSLLHEFKKEKQDVSGVYLSGKLPAASVWDVNDTFKTDFFGGKITVELRDDEAERCDFVFYIRGKNPSETAVEEYIGESPWYAINIAKHESNKNQQGRYYCQFNNPETWEPSKDSLTGACPNFGSPDGWGLMQVDPPQSDDELWNWKLNVDEGKSRMSVHAAIADDWMNIPVGENVTKYPAGGQRVQSYNDLGYVRPVPEKTYGDVTFKDGTSITIEDAVAIKQYQGAAKHHCEWNNATQAWKFNEYNVVGTQTIYYVKEVCSVE